VTSWRCASGRMWAAPNVCQGGRASCRCRGAGSDLSGGVQLERPVAARGTCAGSDAGNRAGRPPAPGQLRAACVGGGSTTTGRAEERLRHRPQDLEASGRGDRAGDQVTYHPGHVRPWAWPPPRPVTGPASAAPPTWSRRSRRPTWRGWRS